MANTSPAFSTPMWTNFYNSAKQTALRNQAQPDPNAAPTVGGVATAPGGAPTLAAQPTNTATAPTTPSIGTATAPATQTPVAAQTPTPTVNTGTVAAGGGPLTPTTPTAPVPPADPNSWSGVQGGLLQTYANAENGTPTAGLQAELNQNNEQLAQYAKSAQAQAAATATAAGSLGQGTAAADADKTTQSVLGQMASTQETNANLVSTQNQAMLSQAQQAATTQASQAQAQSQFEQSQAQQQAQFNTTTTNNMQQFTANLQQNQAQFTAQLGATQAAQVSSDLMTLAGSNPVLAGIMTNFLAAGGSNTGAPGAFTPDQISQMQAYVSQQQGQQSALNTAITTALGTLNTQSQTQNTAATTQQNVTTAQQLINSGNLSGLASNPTALQAAQGAGLVKSYTTGNVSTLVGARNSANAGSTITYNGTLYTVVSSTSPSTGFASSGLGSLVSAPRHSDVTQVVDASGNNAWIMEDGTVITHQPTQADYDAHGH